MGLAHSPKIATDGLVLYYDSDNTKKSWRGKPTTNIAKNSDQTVDWSIGNLVGVVSRSTVVTDEVFRITSTTAGVFRVYFTLAKLTNAVPHTMSFKYKIISGGTTFALTDWCDIGITTTSTNLDNGVIYYTGTGTRSTHDATYRFMDATISANTVVEIWDVQLEQNSFATPYTPYSRSNTESIVDLIGGKTITANSLTYASDGTFSFNGASDYLDMGVDITISPNTQGWTAEYWFKTSSAATLQSFNSAEADDNNSNWLTIYTSKLAVWNVSPGYWKYGSTVFQNNVWYQAVFICDAGGTNMRFYVNGMPEAGDHVGNIWSSEYSKLVVRYIGRYEYVGAYSRHFNGSIPSTKIYNRALSAAEVKQNFDAHRGRYGL